MCSGRVGWLLPHLAAAPASAPHLDDGSRLEGGVACTTRRLAGAVRTPQTVPSKEKERIMESVYKVVELVGTSTESWEKAARNAVEMAAKSLRDLRIAEVVEQDLLIEDDKVTAYRTKVKLSFKYHNE
jgi:flavin-binding protein dodecin